MVPRSVVVLLSLGAKAACVSAGLPLHAAHPQSCTPAPCTHPVPRLAGRAEELPGVPQGGQSRLFTPCHTSSEITAVLSTAPASCLANPYPCHSCVAAARRQGAGRQRGQGYPAGSGAQRKGCPSPVWWGKGTRQKVVLQLRLKKHLSEGPCGVGTSDLPKTAPAPHSQCCPSTAGSLQVGDMGCHGPWAVSEASPCFWPQLILATTSPPPSQGGTRITL